MKLLVTGGAGFIGSNFVRHVLNTTAHSVVNLDALTYAGNLENLAEYRGDPRHVFLRGDIADPQAIRSAFDHQPDAVVHFAAESHVDRSILESGVFIRTNVNGTHALLEESRRRGIGKFVHVSTDEVYGSLGPSGKFTEESPLQPNSPYAASKAASDLLVRACFHTYGFPAVITRCSNNYGPYQFPEKMIPLMVCNAMEDKPLPVYGDGANVRDWIHVGDHCAALLCVLEKGLPGEVYNLGGNSERTNLELVRRILEILGKPQSLIRFVADRPGHDRRYAIDASKAQRDLDWVPQTRFEDGLEKTLRWYQTHGEWVQHVRSGAYLGYYEGMYERRDQTLSNL